MNEGNVSAMNGINIIALEKRALQIRKNIIKMLIESKSGHPGGSLSAVEILTALYFTQMDITKENQTIGDRDKFILSKGHACPVLYATLSEKSLLDENLLMQYRKINSILQGHPNMHYLASIDASTGSLGQGISIAVGMALSNKLHKKPHCIYTLIGDGECQEGQVWEALMCAAHYKLDNLIVLIDCNGLQIDGSTKDIMNVHSLDEKIQAFGCHSILLEDGHDIKSIILAFEQATYIINKPTVIIACTIKGKGISFMENQVSWHGKVVSDEEGCRALLELEGGVLQ